MNGVKETPIEVHTPRGSSAPQIVYPPLTSESRITVDTATAAFHLNRRPQTMRKWACQGDGPLRPVRINGRLAWPVADLIRVQQGHV